MTIERWECVAMKITSAPFVDKWVRFNMKEEIGQRTGANHLPKSCWTEEQVSGHHRYFETQYALSNSVLNSPLTLKPDTSNARPCSTSFPSP